MDENIRIGRFEDAIDLCSQCHKDANTLRNLKCVQNSFSQQLSESYEAIENAMEASILACTRSFDPIRYEHSILGFRMLGKMSRISELQHSYFTDQMHNACQECVCSYITDRDPDPAKNASKLEKFKR